MVGVCAYLIGVYLCAGDLFTAIYHMQWRRRADFMEFGAALRWDGLWPMLAGTVVVGCAVIARIVLGRCRLCAKRLDHVCFSTGKPWAVSRALKVCPYCSGSLDALPPIP